MGEGYGGSGNMATGLQSFGMGFGWEALQDQQKLLGQFAGADIDPDFSAALGAYAQGSKTKGQGYKSLFKGLGDIFGI
jgi:hypothetical protein